MSSQPKSKPSQRRVAVTGVGLISPLGCTPGRFAAALAEGRSGVTRRADGSHAPRVGGFATEFTGKIDDFGDLEGPQKKAIRKGLKLMCRETQMAVAAAQHALADAGGTAGFDPERVGVVLGSDYMLTLPDDYADAVRKCAAEGDFDFDRWGGDGLADMQPLWMLKYLPNMPASHIAIYNDLRGPNNSLTMREAGGLMAVGEAARIIARGDADRMIAGATGTRVLPMQAVHAVQEAANGLPMHLDAPDGADPATLSRPFDAQGDAMVGGEGAGMVVLEDLESAEARGARTYGEVIGFGSSTVARPGGESLEGDARRALSVAISAALADAGLAANELGHINADGFGIPAVDQAEAEAIHDALDAAADRVPVIALKSYFGCLGAGGGVVELIGSLLAFDPDGPLRGNLPPTLNHKTGDSGDRTSLSIGPAADAGATGLAINATPQGQAAAVCVRHPEPR